MSHHPGHRTTGLRWRHDTGIEKRCDYCPKGMQWWPLTDEFWAFRQTFNRCKACLAKSKYASQRRAYAKDARRRLELRDYQREYRQETKDARRIKNQLAYWADPEKHRAAAKARYERDRARILQQKRLRYWAEKVA